MFLDNLLKIWIILISELWEGEVYIWDIHDKYNMYGVNVKCRVTIVFEKLGIPGMSMESSGNK